MPTGPRGHHSNADDPHASTPLPTDPATRDLVASLLPEYSVVRILGAGGMGTVYLAREPSLRRLVAVKIISSQLRPSSRRLATIALRGNSSKPIY